MVFEFITCMPYTQQRSMKYENTKEYENAKKEIWIRNF